MVGRFYIRFSWKYKIRILSQRLYGNDKKWVFRDDIKAISVFSGAGGLDIGTQLAGIKVIASLDIFEDSVKTIKQNKFFDDAFHEVGDIKKS